MHTTLTDPVDDLLEQWRVIVTHRHVIQEEQRFGSTAQHIVYTHCHQIDTDRIVPLKFLRDLQFRANAIGARYQNRLIILAREQWTGKIELKQTRETAIVADHAGAERTMHEPRQSLHGLLVQLKINSAILVSN